MIIVWPENHQEGRDDDNEAEIKKGQISSSNLKKIIGKSLSRKVADLTEYTRSLTSTSSLTEYTEDTWSWSTSPKLTDVLNKIIIPLYFFDKMHTTIH